LDQRFERLRRYGDRWALKCTTQMRARDEEKGNYNL
jgi:hypothetical protein